MPPFSPILRSLRKTDSPSITSPTKTTQTTKVTITELKCSQCQQVKPVYKFHKRKQSSSGYRRECSDCRSTHRKLLRRNKNARRELTIKQNNACAICGRVDETGGKSLALDHNHETLQVRGLLCMRCNTGIALLGEEPAVLLQAIKYLKKYEPPTPMPQV